MKRSLLLMVAVLLVTAVAGCTYIEEKRAERLGEPVVLEDGSVRLYSGGGTVLLEGIAEAVFPEGCTDDSIVVSLNLSDRTLVVDGYEQAGYTLALDIEDGISLLKPFELILNKSDDHYVIASIEGNITVYEDEATSYEGGVFGVFRRTDPVIVEVVTEEEHVTPIDEEVEEEEADTSQSTESPEASDQEMLTENTDEGLLEEGDTSTDDGSDEMASEEMPTDDPEPVGEERILTTGIALVGDDGNSLRIYEPISGELLSDLAVSDLYPEGIRPRDPWAVRKSSGGIAMVNLLSGEEVMIMEGDGLDATSLLWTEDGERLALAVTDSVGEQSGLWLYESSDGHLTQLSKGSIHTMGWSADGKKLIFGEKNPREDGSYTLMVKLGDTEGNVEGIYGVIVEDGSANIINTYSSQTGDKAYATASIKDPNLGSFTIGLIYDYTSGSYLPLMSKTELYNGYMKHFTLSQVLVDRYSQLDGWLMPEVRVVNGDDIIITYQGHCRYFTDGDPAGETDLDGGLSSTWIDW